MTKIKAHSVKSNCRRAARKAGFDPDDLTYHQNKDGHWYFKVPKAKASDTTPTAQDIAPATTAAQAIIETAVFPPAEAPPAPDDSKGAKTRVLESLLRRPEGATADDIMAQTGWLRHTTRARVATLGKALSLPVAATKEDGRGRVYRLGETS